MRVLGLDLSLTSTGVALHDGSVQRIRTSFTGMERLDLIAREVVRLASPIIDDYLVDLVVIEGYSFNSRASQAHALGELGGVVRHALWSNNIPYVDVPPASLKKYATGKGNASKEEVLVAAVKRLGYDGASNDEADALWLRAMALDAYCDGGVVTVPKQHHDALDAVTWPFLDAA